MMTQLRQRMLEELQRRNYSAGTVLIATTRLLARKQIRKQSGVGLLLHVNPNGLQGVRLQQLRESDFGVRSAGRAALNALRIEANLV